MRGGLVIVTESHKTEDVVLWVRDEGVRSGKGGDVGMWRAEEEEMAEKRWMEQIMAGTGTGLEELRKVVRNWSAWRMLTMTIARIQRIDGTR